MRGRGLDERRKNLRSIFADSVLQNYSMIGKNNARPSRNCPVFQLLAGNIEHSGIYYQSLKRAILFTEAWNEPEFTKDNYWKFIGNSMTDMRKRVNYNLKKD